MLRYRRLRTIDSGFADALRGLATDARGELYAAGDHAVRRYGREAVHATTGPAQCVAVSRDGVVFVGQPGRIEMFGEAGERLGAWTCGQHLGSVTAIGFAGDDVLAADWRARVIRRFDRSGRLLNSIGGDNPVNGFLVCNGVLDFAVDPSGSVIHVANPGKHKVESYSLDGAMLHRFGRFHPSDPAGFSGCCNPTNIAAGRHLYVTEKASPRVKAYDYEGNLVALLGGEEFDACCRNMSVATDSARRVYASDTVRLEVHVFEPEDEDGG